MTRSVTLTSGVLICTATLCGCGTPLGPGSVVGDDRMVGGPGPGISHPLRGTVRAYSGRVTRDEALLATAVAQVRTDSDGHFDLHLPAGEFTLIASRGNSSSHLADGCAQPQVVHVHASGSQTANLTCDVP